MQELIAPSVVVFFDRDWHLIGFRDGKLLDSVASITGIQREFWGSPTSLAHPSERLTTMSVARRMSWAAKRHTTRKEDEAYCLLGIFGVSIPLLYGEGEGAFTRLQEQIIRSSTDQSVFVWHDVQSGRRETLLASCPQEFALSGGVCPASVFDESYELTNAGLRITMPLIECRSDRFLGVLNCHDGGKLTAMWLQPQAPPVLEKSFAKARARRMFSLVSFHKESTDLCTFLCTCDMLDRKCSTRSWLAYVDPGEVMAAELMDIMITTSSLDSHTECRGLQLWMRLKPFPDEHPGDIENYLKVREAWPKSCWDWAGWSLDDKDGKASTRVARFYDGMMDHQDPHGTETMGGIILSDSMTQRQVVFCFRCEFKFEGSRSFWTTRVSDAGDHNVHEYLRHFSELPNDGSLLAEASVQSGLQDRGFYEFRQVVQLDDHRRVVFTIRPEHIINQGDYALHINPEFTIEGGSDLLRRWSEKQRRALRPDAGVQSSAGLRSNTHNSLEQALFASSRRCIDSDSVS